MHICTSFSMYGCVCMATFPGIKKWIQSIESLVVDWCMCWDDFSEVIRLLLFKEMLVMCRVTLADQSTYDAKVVGFDQDKDVAVLHVEAPKDKLRPIPIGVSADLLVGQKVYAIGNPVRCSYWSMHLCYIYSLSMIFPV